MRSGDVETRKTPGGWREDGKKLTVIKGRATFYFGLGVTKVDVEKGEKREEKEEREKKTKKNEGPNLRFLFLSSAPVSGPSAWVPSGVRSWPGFFQEECLGTMTSSSAVLASYFFWIVGCDRTNLANSTVMMSFWG